MTDRRDDWDDDTEHEAEPPAPAPTGNEGVRILGAEEAQAKIDAGHVAQRLGDDEVRYGDVPERPDPTIRPAISFPLPADESERTLTPQAPEEEPELRLPLAAVPEPPAPTLRAVPAEPTRPIAAVPEPPAEETVRIVGAAPAGEPDETGAEDAVAVVDISEAEVEEVPAAPVGLPHWSEPPTGEVPVLLPEAEPVDMTGEHDVDAWAAAAGAPRFRADAGDWAASDMEATSALRGDEEAALGALGAAVDDDESFEREVAARRRIRTRPAPAPRAPQPEEHHDVPADLPTRVITGIGVAVLALICFRLGRAATTTLVAVITGLAALELFDALRRRHFRPAMPIGVLGALAIVPIAYQRGEFAYPFVTALVVVFTLLWFLLGIAHARPLVNIATTLMGFLYVGGLAGFAGLLLGYSNGVGLIIGLALCVIAYDVFGYLVGSQFGKTRIAPHISPNKTLEGLAGGMVASIVTAVLVVSHITPWDSIGHALWLGVVVAVMAPLGDLCESMIKRDLGVKDFGTVLPGHGGVLDRFDAMLFVLPAVYFLARALSIG